MDEAEIPTSPAALLQLMQLASPALPVGGFSYSEGLEAAVEAGLVRDEAQAGDWLLDQLHLGLARADLPLLAQALQEPDEIWARVEWMHLQARAVVRRRYVARFVVEGEQAPALAVFEHGADGWTGITTFQGATQTEEEWRVGVLLYKRLAE